MTTHYDVLIVGAGLSGIGAACHLEAELPELDYAVLERRDAIGGTWDLFRYPGVRSDSDMHTLGYRFRPWDDDKILAGGADIKQYVIDTAEEYGVTDKVRYGVAVQRYSWDGAAGRWTVHCQVDGKAEEVTADFVWNCTGYYSYDAPHLPVFPGIDDFEGQVIHPQFWPEDLDYTGKRVVIIGSGATAITLVPAMAEEAAKVTMLQRTPTYVVSVPGSEPIAHALKKVLPEKVVASTTRWRNVGIQSAMYQLSQRRPELAKKLIKAGQKRALPKGYDIDTHFSPPYNPWDQRMCVVPDGDMFKAIRKGKADIATGHIESFTKTGIRLLDGSHLDADIVVTATGLSLQAFGGATLEVDGEELKMSDAIAYKGIMLAGVPNFAYVIGYSNASWTLRADLISEWVVRLLKRMRATGAKRATPILGEEVALPAPILDLSSGYVQRAVDDFPKQGDADPWRVHHNYVREIAALRLRKVAGEELELA